MNTRKSISYNALLVGACVLLAAVLFPVAKAGVKTVLTPYTAVSLTNVPASIAASSASANTEFVDVTRTPSVYVTISGSLTYTNPAAATLTIPVYRSIDGVTAEDTALTSLVLTFTGTATKTWGTNITVGDAGYLKFGGYTSTATNIATNITVRVTGKPPFAVTYPWSP